MYKADVVVIGAGIAGASVTYELSSRGVDVALVDGAGPGTGTTAASYGLANAFAKKPREYFDLNFAAMREYDRFVDELPDTGWLHRGGSINPANHFPDRDIQGDGGDPIAIFGAAVREMISWGYAAELLDARTVRADLEPDIDLGDPDLPVWHFPGEFCVDAVTLTHLLVAQANARGAASYFGSMVNRVESAGGAFAVRLADGTVLHADAVVNAAGPSAGKLGKLVGSAIPLRESTWGLTTLVGPVEHPPRHSVVTVDIELRPEGANLVRLHNPQIDDLLAEEGCNRADLTNRLLDLAVGVMPTLASAHVVSSHVGFRPIPIDGVSSLGRVPSVDGYYEFVTHSAVTLGPLLGRLLAAEIVDGTIDPLLHQFRPERFAGRSLAKQ